MDANTGVALQAKLAGRVAQYADRREDWSVFGFETGLDPRYARAQRRYLGASGSVDPSDLRGAIPATAFTMSIQSMPAGNRIRCITTGPRRFSLCSTVSAWCAAGTARKHRHPLVRALVCLSPFLQHEVFNTSPGECHLQTLLAKPKPLRPQYADPELLKVQARRDEAPDKLSRPPPSVPKRPE